MKSWRRRIKRNKWLSSLFRVDRRTLVAAGVILLMISPFVARNLYHEPMPAAVDPSAYTPLLETIAKGESEGNYNAHYGNASNTTVRFTEMTIGEVLQWQDDYVKAGNPSNAVGKYQFMGPTLRGLMVKLDISADTKFDATLQDRLAIALLEKRGALDFVESKMTRQQFAANLAKEWAALPKVLGTNPHQSYYAGDGLNKVQVTIDEVYTALGPLKVEKNL